VDVILAARNAGGPFTSLTDFCCRTSEHGTVTRSTIEALIQCGAFDSICGNRRALVETLDACCQLASKAARDRECGQGDLFLGDDESGANQKPHDVVPPNVPDYALAEKLKFEKELLGLYISDHPLRQYRGQIEKEGPDLVEDLQEKGEREAVRIGGLITSVKPFRSKKSNEPMAFFTLEDLTGKSVAVTVFPSVF
jgi:DNA polymerase-3 subunit alpha